MGDKDGGEIWCKLTGLFFRFLHGQPGIDVAIHFHTAKRFNIDCSYNAWAERSLLLRDGWRGVLLWNVGGCDVHKNQRIKNSTWTLTLWVCKKNIQDTKIYILSWGATFEYLGWDGGGYVKDRPALSISSNHLNSFQFVDYLIIYNLHIAYVFWYIIKIIFMINMVDCLVFIFFYLGFPLNNLLHSL